MSSTNNVNLAELTVDTTIELLWPPSAQWQTGTITHVWGNGEFAIQFEDDPFDEPLSYRLESYEFRVLSSRVKKEKTDADKDGDIEMKEAESKPAEQSTADQAEKATPNTTETTETVPTANGAAAAAAAAAEPEQPNEDEIEAVIDYVENNEEALGDIFCVYRIKWKGFGLSEATWEPKDHLNDANEMIDRYNSLIKACNPNSSNVRAVRRSPFDNNLLHDLWNLLNEIGENDGSEYGVVWASEGRAFHIVNVDLFVANFMSRNKHNIIEDKNYDSFSLRLTVLGFEQEKDANLYHHPCFNKSSNKLIDFIGKNSIPLPDDDDKAALFKSRVLKEKQQQIHPIIDDFARPLHNNFDMNMNVMNAMNTPMGNDRKRSRAAVKMEEVNLNYNYGLFVPIESGLDLNQCHTWTEHEVGEWIRHLPDWGNYYAAKFVENGIDGRILLEFEDLELVMKEADIQPIHKATFIYGVNMLRSVRRRGIQQMRQSQGK